jgi:hypothetical protein
MALTLSFGRCDEFGLSQSLRRLSVLKARVNDGLEQRLRTGLVQDPEILASVICKEMKESISYLSPERGSAWSLASSSDKSF